jgi:hypothetical protein
MKISNVKVVNWEPPGPPWWDMVEKNPEFKLVVDMTLLLTFEEYKNLLKQDRDHDYEQA